MVVTSRMELRLSIQKASSKVVLYGLLSSSFWFPAKTESFNFVHIEDGLTISISKNSPPRAIIEDEYIQPIALAQTKTIIPKAGEILLQAGLKEFKPDISKQERELSRIARALQKVENQSTIVPIQPEIKLAEVETHNIIQKVVELKGLSLSSKEAVRVVINEERVGATKGDVAPGFGEAFKVNTKIIDSSKEEDRGSEAIPEEELADLPIAHTLPKLPATEHKKSAQTSPQVKYVVSNSKKSEAEESPTNIAQTESAHMLASRKKEIKDKKIVQALVQGRIELADGLALIDGARLEVFHEVLGAPLERGEVFLQEGKYEIFIQDLSEGTLVAEVRDADDFLLGRANISIDEIELSAAETLGQKTVHITVRPVSNSVEGKVYSQYAPTKGEKNALVTLSGVPQQIKTNHKGEFTQTKVLHDSQVLVSASKTGHWGTVLLADNAQEISVGLYPEKMIQALAELAKADTGYEKGGIIWGRVESNGKPVEGASIEGSLTTAIGPIYFNSLQLPDVDLKATSANGLFAYIDVDPGMQIIRAVKNEKEFPTKVVFAEARAVSQVNIESSAHKKARVAIYDAFASAALKSELRFSGTENVAHAEEGLLKVKYNSGRDLLFLEAEADYDYLPVRQVFNRDVSFINFPMVKRAWLEEKLNTARINRIPRTAIAIGFIQGYDFDIITPDGVPVDVIYFNQAGQSIGSEGGVAGGGFVIANIPAGLQSLGIVPKNKNAVATRVFFADPAQVSLINYRF